MGRLPNYRIAKKDPALKIDLSEADLFFRGCGDCCGSGWFFEPALSYAQSQGIPDEACYPYPNGPGSSRIEPAGRSISLAPQSSPHRRA